MRGCAEKFTGWQHLTLPRRAAAAVEEVEVELDVLTAAEGVRRKIHWMAALDPSPSCGGGGGGGGGGTTMSLLLLSRSRKRRKHSGVSFLLWPRSFSRMARFVHFSALTRNSGAFNCSRLLTL